MHANLSNTYNGQIGPGTQIMLGSFRQMTDFSSTGFYHSNPDGTIEIIYAPDEVLSLIIQRNAASFNQILEHKYAGSQKNIPNLDAFRDGPEKVVDVLIGQFHGRYSEIDFDLPEFVAGWARQFGRAGYDAIEKLCESMRASKPAPLDIEHASLDDLFRHSVFSLFSLQRLLQRFLEGDEEHYFVETLGIEPEISDRGELFKALRLYLSTHPCEYDREILWRVITVLRNGSFGTKTSLDGLDFIDGLYDLDFEGAFKVIETQTLSEVLAREQILINDAKYYHIYGEEALGLYRERLESIKTSLIDERIGKIIHCLETGENPIIHLNGLSIEEQEIIFLSLKDIWRKPGQKRDILNMIGISLFDRATEIKQPLGPETVAYIYRMPGYSKKVSQYFHHIIGVVPVAVYIDTLLQEARTDGSKKEIVQSFLVFSIKRIQHLSPRLLAYIWEYSEGDEIRSHITSLDLNGFIEFHSHVSSPARREALALLCHSQVRQIFHEVRSGNVAPYALFLRDATHGGNAEPFEALFGISGIFLGTTRGLLLPTTKPNSILTKTRDYIVSIFAHHTQSHEKALAKSFQEARSLRQSLLYGFADGYLPIGGKIHFSSSLTLDKVALLHQVVGFGSTAFRLLHADTSLNLPPCQSPLELIAILYRLSDLGILTDGDLQLQLSVPGRVPNMLAGILGSMCLFAKPHKTEYKQEAFKSTHNDKTASCICCYDDGVLDREGFPTIPPHVKGRIDTLGFSNILEVVTYYIVGNLVSQSYFGGKFQNIAKEFLEAYMSLLKKNGLIDMLESKWVHTPGRKDSPEEQEDHYRTVKRCTDILGEDIDNYLASKNASGLSFQVKQLVHDYIIRYNLLPLNEGWVQNYFRYLNYQKTSLPYDNLIGG